jgi:hypothetical protein
MKTYLIVLMCMQILAFAGAIGNLIHAQYPVKKIQTGIADIFTAVIAMILFCWGAKVFPSL